MAGSAWSNQVQNQVVVTGTNGGVFIYSGTPALGNPPVYWITNGGLKDPFGNVLIAIQGSIENVAGTWIAFSTANGFLQWWYSTVGPSGPWTNGASIVSSNTVNGDLALDSNPAGGVGNVVELYLGSQLIKLHSPAVTGNLNGVQITPGAGITALNTGVAETWHAATGFGSGFSAGSPAPSYKLYPDNTVALGGLVNVTSGTTSGTVFTLPTGYRPLSNKKFALTFSAGTPAAAGNLQATIGTTGTVQISAGPTGSAYNTSLDVCRFPLDF